MRKLRNRMERVVGKARFALGMLLLDAALRVLESDVQAENRMLERSIWKERCHDAGN